MTIEMNAPRTRRALLAGGIGGMAAWAAAAIGRASPVQADGEIVHVGDVITTATVRTEIRNQTNDTSVFLAASGAGGIGVDGQSTTGYGVHGVSQGTAIFGEGGNGSGVFGISNAFSGVSGTSTNNDGVRGESITHVGVNGLCTSGTGVIGSSGVFVQVAKPKTGVYGLADQDGASRGVWGQSAAGQGVRGQTNNGRGVTGVATSGTGVWGEATIGYALRTIGRVRLDKSAGQASITNGTSSVVVTPGIDLVGTSAVVATLNGNAGGTTTIHRVAIDTTANTFTVYLTANATATVKLAWVVLG